MQTAIERQIRPIKIRILINLIQHQRNQKLHWTERWICQIYKFAFEVSIHIFHLPGSWTCRIRLLPHHEGIWSLSAAMVLVPWYEQVRGEAGLASKIEAPELVRREYQVAHNKTRRDDQFILKKTMKNFSHRTEDQRQIERNQRSWERNSMTVTVIKSPKNKESAPRSGGYIT